MISVAKSDTFIVSLLLKILSSVRRVSTGFSDEEKRNCEKKKSSSSITVYFLPDFLIPVPPREIKK